MSDIIAITPGNVFSDINMISRPRESSIVEIPIKIYSLFFVSNPVFINDNTVKTNREKAITDSSL